MRMEKVNFPSVLRRGRRLRHRRRTVRAAPTADVISVVGAGVSGLTCGIALREAGIDAHIIAREDPLHTVSAVAAAVWYPLRGEMDDATQRRMAVSYEAFLSLASVEDTGIVLRDGIEIFHED